MVIAVHDGVVARRTTGLVRGQPFTVAYAGVESGLAYLESYLVDRVFQSAETTASAGSGLDADADADLIVVAREAGDAVPAAGVRLGVLPLRIHLAVWLQDHPASGGPSPREVRRQRRRVRTYEYTYEVSRRDRDFDFFYDRMHAPTMASRHAYRARTVSRSDAFEALFADGLLFLVRSRGEPVAGVLCHVVGDVCNARLVGWLDGDPRYLHGEALKTANHFLIGWARAEGYRLLDFQGCEPFLRKGTFQSKRHLGTTAFLPDNPLGRVRVHLMAGRDSGPLRDFLVANPPIVVDGQGRLGAAYFRDRSRPPAVDVPHRCDGLDFVTTVDLDECFAEAKDD
jgi:hypothetical protein